MLRSYVRQRARLVRDGARCVQHMEKALAEMNVHLDTVLSDIMGKTGQRILRAIVAGERDGTVLAAYRDQRVKADAETIARSLRGSWRYALLTRGEAYVDRGITEFETAHHDRQVRRLQQKARQLGFTVVPQSEQAVA